MATTAHTEVPGGHKAPFPPFQADTFASQLFWLVIAFGVFATGKSLAVAAETSSSWTPITGARPQGPVVDLGWRRSG